jgi:hypothetical protein
MHNCIKIPKKSLFDTKETFRIHYVWFQMAFNVNEK